MMPENPSERHQRILQSIHRLPKKLVVYAEQDNLAEFVLHELCHYQHFDLAKAAYLVNNKDFDCLRGVAGYVHEHALGEGAAPWSQPEQFSLSMRQSPFNKAVREIVAQSIQRNDASEASSVAKIAQAIGIENPQFISWDLKHDNQGYLLYQAMPEHNEELRDHLHHSLFLLSFCPLF